MGPNHNAENDRELLSRLIRGDNAAFHGLYRQYAPPLERYIRKLLGPHAPIGDLSQELWERVINLRRKPPKEFDRETFQVQAFFFRIAHNLVIDHVRTRKLHESIDEAHEVPNEVAERSEAEDIVTRAMDMLSVDFREVLYLNLQIGFRFDEIAVMLDKTPDAIWARASRARAKLREVVVELAKKEGVCLKDYIKVSSKQSTTKSQNAKR